MGTELERKSFCSKRRARRARGEGQTWETESPGFLRARTAQLRTDFPATWQPPAGLIPTARPSLPVAGHTGRPSQPKYSLDPRELQRPKREEVERRQAALGLPCLARRVADRWQLIGFREAGELPRSSAHL